VTLHTAKRERDGQILIPIYLMVLVPLGIVLPVPQDGCLVPNESLLLGGVCARACTCVWRVREEPSCALGKYTWVPSVEVFPVPQECCEEEGVRLDGNSMS